MGGCSQIAACVLEIHGNSMETAYMWRFHNPESEDAFWRSAMKPLPTADETRPGPSVQMGPHPQAAHETALLVAAKAGDHQAFEELLRIYERPIH